VPSEKQKARVSKPTMERDRKREKKPKKVRPFEPLKIEIASELGLMEKVRKSGWGGLTSRESGQLGGLMTRRIRSAVSPKGIGDKAVGNGKPET